MKRFKKRNGILLNFCIISLFSFHVLAAADKVISTFEPGATGEVGFSSYEVKNSSGTTVTASTVYASGPSVQANDVSNSNNSSANCFKMVTTNDTKRSGALVFMNTNVTPTTAQKYLKFKVRRDYTGNSLKIFINGTPAGWNGTPKYTGLPSSVWQDVVLDITSYATAGTAITNLLIEPVDNNSVGLGFPVTVCIDDIVLSETNTSRTASLIPPIINISTASFNNFGYTYGFTPSTVQSYTVGGTGLVDDIAVTPPAHYEISLSSGSGYQSTALVLTKDGSGNVATTTIYTRLKAGNAAGSYTYPIANTSLGATTQTVSVSGTVYKKCLTISGITVAASKTYSGTTAATVSGTAGTLTGSGATTATDGKWFTGDGPFTYSGTFATGTSVYNSKDVLTANYVTYGGLTLSSGTNSANYVLAAPAIINPRGLTGVTSPSVTAKVYDGTTTASITGTFANIVGADVVTLTGAFDTKDVGTGKSVTATAVTGGAQGSNYTYTGTVPTGLTGSITAKPLTIIGLTANNKVYDGNTSATYNGTATYSGLVTGETFTVSGTPTAAFADANVASLKAVTFSGYTAPNSNYSITQPTAPAAITAKALSIGTPTIASKVYDGSATSGTVTPGALSGFIGSETVTVASAVGTYADANIEKGKTATIVYTLADGINGGLAANYSLANGVALGDIILPVISKSVASLTGLNANPAPSSTPGYYQTFTISATDLLGDVTITAPSVLELSTTGGDDFTSPITITKSGSSISTTTIYVRAKAGLTAQTFSAQDITLTSTSAVTQTIACSGVIDLSVAVDKNGSNRGIIRSEKGQLVLENLTGSAEIYTATGNLVRSMSIPSDKVSVSLAKGLYIVKNSGRAIKIMIQ